MSTFFITLCSIFNNAQHLLFIIIIIVIIITIIIIIIIIIIVAGPGSDDTLKKLLPSWMISGGSTKNISREREGSGLGSGPGPTLEKQQKDPPQAKQHNFNGLLHPFFRLRSSLGGKTL